VTSISNLSASENEGALNGDNIHVTSTVQDAMTLTSLIRKQYLWVNASRIVQNDEVEKLQQIEKIDSIFALAQP
jgi:Heterokaryon incompatibility protein (HET)